MQTTAGAHELRETLGPHRRAGRRIALVPTMGNLHEGHFSLVEIAKRHADVVAASVFVNPTQFGPSEDFARYPRTPEADAAGLERHGCDVLFLPTVDTIYPFGAAATVRVHVPELGDVLEGASRPGHFSGVATVVAKLFNLVQPDVAVFGQKDYQQLLVIRRLVHDLAFPIDVIAAPTLREPNGLAMSSRNQYLTATERDVARVIDETLRRIQAEVNGSGAVLAEIEREARERLAKAGLEPDYVAVRRAADLAEPGAGERRGLVALIAARLGAARLIDNRLLDP